MQTDRCLCGFALALAILVAGCGRPTASEKPKAKPLTDLVAGTIEIELANWPKVIRSQGELRADEVVAIGTRVAGRVANVHVELGDRVAAGQPLVSLEPEEFRLLVEQADAQLAQARSAVGLAPEAAVASLVPENSPPVRQERVIWDEAKSSLLRAGTLKKQNAIAQGEFDLLSVAERVAEARYASSLNAVREKLALIGVRQAELSLARQRLGDATVVAPFDGYVQQRQVAPGAYLNVGNPIVSLVRTDPLWFRGNLPERYTGLLREGLDLTLNVESTPAPLEATITRISPALDPQSRSMIFEARIANPENTLRAGLFAEADLVLDPAAQSIVIPAASVIQFAGAEKVWKVVDSISAQYEIITGQSRNGFVEVLEGLEIGDVILADGPQGRVGRIKPMLPGEPEPVTPVHAMVNELEPNPEG